MCAMLQLPLDTERRKLIHRPRAERLMRQHGVAAMVAAHPVNVYYCSNFWTVLQKMGFDFPALTVLPCEAQRGETLVVSAAQIWRLALGERDYPERIIAVTGPLDFDAEAAHLAIAAPLTPWPVTPGLTPSAIQERWLAASHAASGREAATSAHGLAQALRESGLERSRIAIDDVRIAEMLARVGLHSVECVLAPNLFRKLRVVKSEPELVLMRQAAQINAAVGEAVAQQIRVGMTQRDIEALFGIEAARRGAQPVFIASGSTGFLPHGEVRRGEPLLLDVVSHYRYYHGDYGRTVVVGDPNRETQRRVEAMRIGWEASFAALRPGKRYSEIQRAGLDAIAKSGYRYLTVAHPHSVGLQHTDEPFRDAAPFEVKDDIVLEEGMTLTVDFPHIEVGFGACHLEDLVEITASGARPLASMESPLLVVGE
jgi:Xaa-Pro aminopeptidase